MAQDHRSWVHERDSVSDAWTAGSDENTYIHDDTDTRTVEGGKARQAKPGTQNKVS